MSAHLTRRVAAVCAAFAVALSGCAAGNERGAPFGQRTPTTAAVTPGGGAAAGDSTAPGDLTEGLPGSPAPNPGSGPRVSVPEGASGPLTGEPGPLQAPELPDARPLPTPNTPTTAPVGAMPTVPAAEEGRRIPARVLRVIDGDTFVITGAGSGEQRLRVIGYDTPEIHSGTVECYGTEAARLAEQLVGGKPILLEGDPTQPAIDRYGRVLAHVYTNENRLLGEVMIRAGAAVEMTVGNPHRHQGTYRAAEATARAERVGQWGAC